ncbi:phage regulatory CII family protein [Sphingobium boeckii]|uniref:Uncharacterized protein n=1 Tax=Sphingobium boeckii TaxID=1082345 RepID=A0A7W9EE51_9SPHN|nr:phage regulatory CII family protein [Sphingobium boeckii]MBB5684321.1 hypothetical protein [Sphingobium boeckii]
MSRHETVLSPDEQAEALAAKKLIRAAGGLEDAAAHTGKSTSALSRYCLPNCPDSMPVRVAIELESVTHGSAGHPVMTRLMAQRQGFALVKLPDPMACSTIWSGFVAKLAKEGGDVMAAVCRALEDDNDVSPAEATATLNDVQELIDIAVQLRAALVERAGAVAPGWCDERVVS